MNIVLIGKDGQLGWELERSLPILGNVFALGRTELDVCDPNALQQTLRELKPGLIINASAYTEVDGAEKEPELAMKVNALAPGIMAEISRKLDAVFIHYSTDYVFDGHQNTPYTEEDQTNPLNVYGQSKLIGEENIKQAGNAYLGWARKNSTLRIVDDQVSGPTWARMLAQSTSLLLAQNQGNLYQNIYEQCGIYHLAGSGYTSRYEWAKQILANDPDRAEQSVQSIEPARSAEFPTPATRPLFSALDCTRFEKTFGLRLPPWNRTLELAMAG
jgi:dTDP-4-dehydrorhamnose reductase